MLKKYDKKIILFPAGASGHFLGEFLTIGKTFVLPQQRIDLGQSLSSAIFVSDLEHIKDVVINTSHQVILSHYSNISDLEEFKDQYWLRKVYPKTNLFGWTKNVFYKKQQIEKVNYSQATMLQQFDSMFLNLEDFYFQIKQDTDCPADLTIDFGQILNLDFLIDLYREANNEEPDDEKKMFAQSYINQQGPVINDCDYTNITDIINLNKPMDLYDLAILLFIYEKNHNTIDQNRNWTINDLPTDVNRAVEFLVSNAKNYSIF